MATDPGRQRTNLTKRVRVWTAASVGAAVIAATGLTVMLEQQASADTTDTSTDGSSVTTSDSTTSDSSTSDSTTDTTTSTEQTTAAQAPVATQGEAHAGSGGS